MDSILLNPASLLLLLSIALSPVQAQSCQQYKTTGVNGTSTFNHYQFFDYRRMIDQESGTPYYTQNINFSNPVFGMSTSAYFNSTPWTDNWSTSARTQQNNLTLSQYFPTVYTALNLGIVQDDTSSDPDDTVLSLSTSRLDTYSVGAQINTNQRYMYASARISAKITGPAGACAGFFFYGDDNNESDMEVLTNDTNTQFHATNHPSQDAEGNAIPGATSIVALPKNGTKMGTSNTTFNEWTEYRIDWIPGVVNWYINGVPALSKTLNVPHIPAWLGLNMWSNGGTWTGNMTVNDTATFDVRWIEIVYNTTDDKPKGCAVNVIKDNNDGTNGLPNVNSAVSAVASSGVLMILSGVWLCFFLGLTGI